MSWSIAVLARLALCAVSAGSKLASGQARTAFAEAVTGFGAVPAPWSRPAAGAVVLTEVALAAGMCVNSLSRLALCAAAAVLLAFGLVLGTGLRRGVLMPCACFGASHAPARSGEIWRNVLLAALAVAGAAWDTAPAALLGGPAAALVVRLLIAAFMTVLAAGFSDFTFILTPRRTA
jgi:Methylamine utilisation protein MauE